MGPGKFLYGIFPLLSSTAVALSKTPDFSGFPHVFGGFSAYPFHVWEAQYVRHPLPVKYQI
jgi:hypothetical protein